jgi:hypothetical protein
LDLHPGVILPFTWQQDDMKSGAFGEVHQVTVHPSHHKDPVLTVSSLYPLIPCRLLSMFTDLMSD